MEKVEVTPDCWLWKGWTAKGYGMIKVAGRGVGAHRVSYELFVGPIPDGFEPDHLCKNTMCVRPDHLEPVTHQENVLRGSSPAATHAQQLTCVQGHPFTR